MSTDREHILNIAAVRAAIEGGLRNIEHDPERGVRNMLDLGKYFSHTHRQRSFFQMAQRMLGRKRSQYMQLVKRAVGEVDRETLKTIGINMGYFSWSQGAKVIRETERVRGFNVPWSIVINMTSGKGELLNQQELCNILDQAHKLGIHCYWIVLNAADYDTAELFNVFGSYKDCSFFILASADIITVEFAENALAKHNISISVCDNSNINFETAVNNLHDVRLLFGLYYTYDDSNAQNIISGKIQSDVDECHGQYALFIPTSSCSDECRTKVQKYANGEKNTPERPPFMVDFFTDLSAVDQIISLQTCYIEIDGCGNIKTAPDSESTDVNIRTHTLEDALLQLAPRASSNAVK